MAAVVEAIRSDRTRWVDFMMRFELGLEEPDPRRARHSALTIAVSYVAGGLMPLAPYLFLSSVRHALLWSVPMTLLALPAFGYVKGRFTTPGPCGAPGRRPWSAPWPPRRRSAWRSSSADATAGRTPRRS